MKIEDPIIDEIRRVRHEISEKVGHDPQKLVELYIETQKRHQKRLVYREVAKLPTPVGKS